MSTGVHKPLDHSRLQTVKRVPTERKILYNIEGVKVLANNTQSAVVALISFKNKLG